MLDKLVTHKLNWLYFVPFCMIMITHSAFFLSTADYFLELLIHKLLKYAWSEQVAQIGLRIISAKNSQHLNVKTLKFKIDSCGNGLN